MRRLIAALFVLISGVVYGQVDPSYIDAQRPDDQVLITKDSVLTYFDLGSFLEDSLGIPIANYANGGILVGSPTGGITSYPITFYWNNTDRLLGLGTSSPSAGIHYLNDRSSLARFEATDSDSAFFSLVNTVQTYNFQINTDGSFQIEQGVRVPFKIGDQIEINYPVVFSDTIRSYDGSNGNVGDVWTIAANGKVEWSDPGTLTNDDQTLDTARIVNDTLELSLSGDGEPVKRIDLKPYSNTADDQAVQQFDISNDSLRLKIENDVQNRIDLTYLRKDTLFIDGDSLGLRQGNKVSMDALKRTQEEIEDIAGAMVSGNTETGITVTYNDVTGKFDFVALAGSDNQQIDSLGVNGDTLIISLGDDGVAPLKVVLPSGGGGTDDQVIDTFELAVTDLRLSLEGDNQPFQVVDLSGLDSDDQLIDTLRLVGTTLEISIQDDDEPKKTLDLSPLQDGTGTDDQNLSIDSVGRVFTITIEGGNSINFTDTKLTEGEVDGFVANNGYLTSEVDGSVTNELQDFDVTNLNGTDLELSLTDDPTTHTVDLSPLQDGVGTDDQTVDKFNLKGTTLELSLENDGQADETVDLSSLQDGTGTDDQTLTLVGTDLSIESGNTVDLSTIQDGTGTDDQDLTLVGNTLSIENDPNTDVDLTPYEKLTQTQVQDYVKPMVTGNIETLIDVTVTSQRFDFVVEDDLSLYDNTTSGFLTSEVDGSTTNEIQTIDTFRLVGTTLEGSLSSDSEAKKTVDLSSLQDGVFDGDAIHDNVSDEFSGVSQKLEPSNADRILIEDSGAGFAKKWIRVDSLEGGAGGGGGADGVATSGVYSTVNDEIQVTVAAPGSSFDINLSSLAEESEVPGLETDATALSALVDSAADIRADFPVNTDDQNLSFDPKSGNDVTLNIQDGVDVTFREGANMTLTRSGSNLLILEASGDGTGTDDQDLTLVGNTLAIENDPNTDVDLSAYLDNTDAQTLSFGTGTGDLTISGGNTANLDGRYLQSEVDGSTTNELQNLALVGSDLTIQNGNTVDLSVIKDGVVTSGTHNQVAQELQFTVTGGSDFDVDVSTLASLAALIDSAGDIRADFPTPIADDQTLSWNGGTGEITIVDGNTIDIDGRYLEFEVDGSVANEGSLTVGAGTATTSIINSNTTASTPVTLEAGTGITLAEAGNTITITGQAGSDDQTIDKLNLNGTTLEISLEDDGVADETVDLSSLQDGTGTDNQNLDVGTFNTGTGDLVIGIEDGTDQTVNLDGRYLEAEVDGSVSNELQDFDITNLNGTTLELSLTQDATQHDIDLSSLQDGTGTDDQTFDVSQLVGTDLQLSLENDGEATKVIDLSSLQDGTGTDNQNLDVGTFNSTNGELTIGIEDGSDQIIDLDGRWLLTESDGSVTNELQDFDIANLNGTTLELSLTQDATQHDIDLSSLQDGTGTDDQDLTLVGNTLSIENDPNTDVDLSPYLDNTNLSQTQVQDFVKPMVTGNIETLIDVTSVGQRFDFVVEDDLSLYDNTTSGFLTSEVDGSTSNELQDFDIAQLSGTDLELSLTQDATTHTIDLSSLGGGGVSASGTPVNDQLAIWTNSSTIEGDVDLTFDGTKLDATNLRTDDFQIYDGATEKLSITPIANSIFIQNHVTSAGNISYRDDAGGIFYTLYNDNHEIRSQDGFINVRGSSSNNVQIYKDSINMENSSINYNWYNDGTRLNLERENIEALAVESDGDVKLGNYRFDRTGAVGAGQDNYVLKYDNASGHISLEPDETGGGGGGGDVYKSGTFASGEIAVGVNDSTLQSFSGLTYDNANTNLTSGTVTANDSFFVDDLSIKADISGSYFYRSIGNPFHFGTTGSTQFSISTNGSLTALGNSLTLNTGDVLDQTQITSSTHEFSAGDGSFKYEFDIGGFGDFMLNYGANTAITLGSNGDIELGNVTARKVYYDESTGRFGVGVSPSTYKFEVEHSNNNVAGFYSSGAFTTIDIASSASNDYYLQADSDAFSILEGVNTMLKLWDNGEIGIGTGTAPSAGIDVDIDGVTELTPHLAGDLKLNGNAIIDEFTGGETIAAGEVCTMAADLTDGEFYTAVANDEVLIQSMMVMAAEAGSNGVVSDFVIRGKVGGFVGLTTGKPYYVAATSGDISANKPASGQWARVIGYALSSTELFFDPSNEWIKMP